MLTYQKLQTMNAQELTVRNLAAEMQCSVAALYRHFESLEYLVAVASIRFLDDYMRQYADLLDSNMDFVRIYIQGWKLYNHYAFERPDIYYPLFWGPDNTLFGSAFQEYYELFPFEGSEKLTAYYYSILFNDDIRERDFIILRRMQNLNFLDGKAAYFLSYTNPLIVKGMVDQAVFLDEEERKKQEILCNDLIEQNTMSHIKQSAEIKG